MQQNQIILLVVLIVIGVVIVAAVLLMSGGGPAPATPPAPTTPSEPTTPTTPTEPTTPTTPPTLPTGVDFNSPFECEITMIGPEGTVTMTQKMEMPKLKATVSSPQGDTTILTADGLTYYMYDPSMGQWLKMTMDPSTMEIPDADTLAQEYENPPEGVTYDCRNIGDIPDSEFELPAGADVVDLEDLMAGLEGSFEPSGGTAPGMSGFTTVKPNEWMCSGGTLSLVIVNAAGQQITLTGESAADCEPDVMSAGSTGVCIIDAIGTCATAAPGERYEETVDISYQTASGLDRLSSGTVWGSVE